MKTLPLHPTKYGLVLCVYDVSIKISATITHDDESGNLGVAAREIASAVNRELVRVAKIVRKKHGVRVRTKVDLAGGWRMGYGPRDLEERLGRLNSSDNRSASVFFQP